MRTNRKLSVCMAFLMMAVVLAMIPSVAAQSATRTLPDSVKTGETFSVTMAVADYGAFGQVVETLPDGFSYVDSSLSPNAVTLDDQTVKFTLLGETSFTYNVTASSTEGTYTFTGILKDEHKNEYQIEDTGIEVKAQIPTATRTLPDSVKTGETFSVTMAVADYGTFGQVVETLPDGFSYVDSSLPADSIEVNGKTVKFTLLGETSFTYNVTASSTEGTYTFTGILKDEDKNEYQVGGDKVTVVSAPAPSQPSRPSGGGGGGGGGGIPLPPPLAAPSEFYTSLIKYLKANEPRVIAMTSDIIDKVGILEIQAVIQQTMSVSTTVSKVSSLPSGVTEPEGNVYSFFEIVFTQHGTQKKVEPSGYLKYRVSKEWLSSINAEPSDIKFLKWDNGWIELSSEIVDEDDDYYYFKVNLDSFSLFAVVSVKKVTTTPQIPEETETSVPEKTKEITTPTPITTTPTPAPAWWQQPTGIAAIVIVIGAIIVLAYALRRK